MLQCRKVILHLLFVLQLAVYLGVAVYEHVEGTSFSKHSPRSFFRREQPLSTDTESSKPAALQEKLQSADCSSSVVEKTRKMVTLEAWIKWPEKQTNDVNILGGKCPGKGQGLHLKHVADDACETAGKSAYELHLGSSATVGNGSSTYCFTKDNWVHVAAVKHCGERVDFYVNGEHSVGAMEGPCALAQLDGTIGDTNLNAIYNARIWKVNITANEVRCMARKNATTMFPLDMSLLDSLWPMKQGPNQNKNYAAAYHGISSKIWDCKAGCGQVGCTHAGCQGACQWTDGCNHTYAGHCKYTNPDSCADFGPIHNTSDPDYVTIQGETQLQNDNECTALHTEYNVNEDGCDDNWRVAHHTANEESKHSDVQDPNAECCLNDVGKDDPDYCIHQSADGQDPITKCYYSDVGNTPKPDCCNRTAYCEKMIKELGDGAAVLSLLEKLHSTGGGYSRQMAAKARKMRSHLQGDYHKIDSIKSSSSFIEGGSKRAKMRQRATQGNMVARVLNKALMFKGEDEASGPGCSFGEKSVTGKDGKDLVQTQVGSGAKDAPATQEMVFSFPNADYETGSLSVPAGFKKQYSTDDGGTWFDDEPLDGVNKIKATGTFPPAAGAVFPIPPVSAASIDSSGGGGDGSTMLFLRNEVHLFYHHCNPAKAVCINVDAGTDCLEFPKPWIPNGGVSSSNLPVGMSVSFNNLILVPVTGGFLCYVAVKDKAPELCTEPGYVNGHLPSTGAGLLGYGGEHPGLMKLFAVDGSNKIHCVDAEGALCEGFPYTAPINVKGARPMHKVPKLLAWSGSEVFCLDVGEEPPIPCADWPGGKIAKGIGRGGMIPIQDRRGFSIGFCMNTEALVCYDVEDGTQTNEEVKAAQTALNAQIQAQGTIGDKSSTWCHGYLGSSGTRSYATFGGWGGKKTNICYDGAYKTGCRNYPMTKDFTHAGVYSIQPSKANSGGCIWRLGCAGTLASFSARNPEQPCGSEAPVIAIAPQMSVCQGEEDKAPKKWKDVKLINVEDGDFEDANLLVIDLAGNQLLDEPLGASSDAEGGETKAVDLSEFDIDGDTAEFEFHLEFTKLDSAIYDRELEDKLSLHVSYADEKGGKPKVCVESETAPETASGAGACEAKASRLASLDPALLLALLSMAVIHALR